jgi:hypothetical protein
MRVDNVMHQELQFPERDDFRYFEGIAQVSIAQYGGGRRDLFQLKNDDLHAHIARVQDVVHPLEQFQNPGIQKIVRVR